MVKYIIYNILKYLVGIKIVNRCIVLHRPGTVGYVYYMVYVYTI